MRRLTIYENSVIGSRVKDYLIETALVGEVVFKHISDKCDI